LKFLSFQLLGMILEPVRESDKLISDFHNVFLSGFEEDASLLAFQLCFSLDLKTPLGTVFI
jgi:hypothetical protein